MKKDINYESLLQIMILGGLTIVGIGWIVINVYNISHPKAPEPIEFKITGIVNSTEPGTLAQLHFECIMYCTKQYGSSGYTKDCYEECAKLGSEGKCP